MTHWAPLASDADHDAGFRAWAMSERDEPRSTWEITRRDARRLFEQLEALQGAAYHAEMCMFAHTDDLGVTYLSLPIGDWLPVVELLQASGYPSTLLRDSSPASRQDA